MKQILCFGDSNTWGYDGESRKRLPWGKRWTSLLQEKFDVETAKQGIQAGNNTAGQREAGNAEHKSGESVRIIEEGLCGEPPYSKTRCVTVAEELHFFPLYWKPMTA